MADPWQITKFLYVHLDAVGARGMMRSHMPELAVLHVRDGFTIWTNGAVIWWLTDGRVEMYWVRQPSELVQLVLARYRALPRRRSTGRQAA